MKIKAILASCMLIIVLCCSSCSTQKPEDTVEAYFEALQTLDFSTAGSIIGDENAYHDAIAMMESSESYLQSVMNNAFVVFVYSNVTYEILSLQITENMCEIEITISAYNINEVLDSQTEQIALYTASQEYAGLSAGDRYIALCDQIEFIYEDMDEYLEPVRTQITIFLEKDGSDWKIIPYNDLFLAISGGANSIVENDRNNEE